MKIVHVAGARPNYVKVAALWQAVRTGMPGVRQVLVDTGQHYDDSMAGVFFKDLALPTPDWDLGVGSGSHTAQVAKVMVAFEEVCRQERPDLVVVVGDVNSTLGAALVAPRLAIPLAHVEAGLRSFDRAMPEELNRIVTDQLADILLTPSADATENLAREGIPPDRIHLVGNVMIDTLLRHLPEAPFDRVRERFHLGERRYGVLTLHRPSNVDRPATLGSILDAVREIAETLPVVFPVHPRTRGRIAEFGFADRLGRVILTEPLGYLDFLSLTAHARVLLTDSGGLQEESVVLGVPCLTLRRTTERPITLAGGTGRLVGSDTATILAGLEAALAAPATPWRPALWDGQAAQRVVAVLRAFLGA